MIETVDARCILEILDEILGDHNGLAFDNGDVNVLVLVLAGLAVDGVVATLQLLDLSTDRLKNV